MEEWLAQWTPSDVIALVAVVATVVLAFSQRRWDRAAATAARNEERAAAAQVRAEEREAAGELRQEEELRRRRDDAAVIVQELQSILRSLDPGLLPPELPTEEQFLEVGNRWWGIRASLDQLIVKATEATVRDGAKEVRGEMSRYWSSYKGWKYFRENPRSNELVTPEEERESLKVLHARTVRTIDGFVKVLHGEPVDFPLGGR